MLRSLANIISKSTWLSKVKKMAEKMSVAEPVVLKRSASPTNATKNKKSKKKKKEHIVQLGKSEGCKRKVALLVVYNGAGYYGVQINPGFPTIESEIFPALVKVGSIPQDHADKPSKMWFQRGSRTDKGVSAAGQIFSLKIMPDLISKVNEILPAQIRAIGYIRTTNGFDSKNFCCNRTYMYMMPTFAYAPVEKFISDDYRTKPEIINRVREVLQRYVGTHKFHNFTSGVKFEEACAARYIISFECSEPYIREGIEFVTIRVKGQSFMLHQIRKMIGLTVAIVKGYCSESAIDAAWQSEKVDIPIAPGLGLVLEQLHFDGYNKKWGCDGVHEPVEWSAYKSQRKIVTTFIKVTVGWKMEEIEDFKEKYIISDIVAKEKNERIMMTWLQTLQFHNFNEPRTEGPQRPWVKTAKMLKDMRENKTEQVDENKVSLVGEEESKPENLSTPDFDSAVNNNTSNVEVSDTIQEAGSENNSSHQSSESKREENKEADNSQANEKDITLLNTEVEEVSEQEQKQKELSSQ